ncbi:MAG: dephospho-CoA kinase [Deltaproteobacteria bacterium]|nr:dephospho-CoA kinase [Deltaproteobacteria bacterium]MBW1862319.1 dephospho-CoA kinase [Deltaproteobacteria bacterium]
MNREKKPDWEKLIRRMELLMRLKSFPVAFKMLEKKEELAKIPFMRRTEHKVTLCQLITLVRNFDWTVGAELDNFMSPVCPSILGLTDTPALYKDGTFRSIVWVKTKEEGKRYEESIPRLPMGKYEAVAMAPLAYKPFEPDIVLIYANPAQMMLLINSLQFEDYEVMHFSCVGESSCSDAIARCYLTGKPSLTIPCYGERRYGHAQDEDLVMAIPAGMMEKALRGMETLYRRGIRYPISFAGAERDLTTAFPMSYGGIDELEAIRGKDNRLLLGLTGGIASGKTTVANMLKEKGATLIDFDLIARQVVEPHKPAWEKIVDYFGKQVLQEDENLDRKKLSNIVFRDFEKRKKLESFTHPRIHEEFVRQVNEIVEKEPDAIIQVDIPLMIELNLQYIFHKLLVVYIPQEQQIKRLAERDGISQEEAANILKAQLSLDEKVRYADFVIHNEHSLEETGKQIENVWKTLKAYQKEMAELK